jgi:hypothetical protein
VTHFEYPSRHKHKRCSSCAKKDRTTLTKKTFIYYLLLILTYTGLYFTTAMVLFNYEGTWDQSSGELWSFLSMTTMEDIAFILWYLPNFPLGLLVNNGTLNLICVCLINPVLIGWTVQKLFFPYRDTIMTYWTKINIGLTALIIIGWTYFIVKDL